MSDETSKQGYFIDQERMEEMYRLAQQDRFLTQAMGGPFPERQNNFTGISDILDLACGSGGWLFGIARHHPEIHCVGLDISERMVEFDTMQARADKISNITFRIANILKPLDLPDQSFDLVNGRLLFGFMLPDAWPQLIRESARVLRSGGVVRMTECETAVLLSTAASRLIGLMTEGMHRLGRTFAPHGRTLGTTAVLGKFMRSAGFTEVSNCANALEFSAGTPLHQPMTEDILSGIRLAQPFLAQLGLSEQEFEALYQQAEAEFADDSFCGIWHFVTWTGIKPAQATQTTSST